MLKTPYILTEFAFNSNRKKLMNGFGQVDHFSDDILVEITSESQRSILCEEFLLAKYIRGENHHLVPKCLRNEKVFEVELAELLKAKRATMVVVPLNTIPNDPEFFHLWLFDGLGDSINDQRHFLDGNKIINSSFKVFISRFKEPLEKFNGTSWQLAYKLAEWALEQNFEVRKKLAMDWIITGAMNADGERVEKVALGNKLELELGKRKWLIPLDNLKNITEEEKQAYEIQSVDEFTIAKSHIDKSGTLVDPNILKTNSVSELHMLIGGNINAQVATAFLFKWKKLVLWYTPFSELQAKGIKNIFKEFMEDGCDKFIELNPLSDKSIVDAEKSLKEYFERNKPESLLFNITSGNRLMSYAVQTLARLYPRINLLYRELGEKDHHKFTLLNYRSFPPYSGEYTGNSNLEINWDFLYGKPQEQKPFDVEEFKTKLWSVNK